MLLLIGLGAFALGIFIIHRHTVKEVEELWIALLELTTHHTKRSWQPMEDSKRGVTISDEAPSLPESSDETRAGETESQVPEKGTLIARTNANSIQRMLESTGETAAGPAEHAMASIRARVRGRMDARGVGSRHLGQDQIWSRYKDVTDRAELLANVMLFGPTTDVHVALEMMLDSLALAGRVIDPSD